jgi:hypothetical protein
MMDSAEQAKDALWEERTSSVSCVNARKERKSVKGAF